MTLEKPKLERSVATIGDSLISTYYFKTLNDTQEILYHSKEGIYDYGGEQIIEQTVRRQVDREISKHDLAEVLYYVQTMTYIDRSEFDKDPNWLHVANGWLNIKTREFIDHSPDRLSLFKIPWNYDKDARNLVQQDFFADVLEAEDLEVNQKLYGYLLLPDQRYKKAFLGIGAKDSGKSKYTELAETFAGKVSHVTLHDLDQDRNHNVVKITTSILNTASEVSKYKLKDVTLFKAITGGDELTFREIYGKPFDTRVRAKILVVGNNKPDFDDMDKTFIERWIVLKFSNIFKVGEDMDENIMQKLTTPAEMSGLLNYAIEGLTMLQKDGYFKKEVWSDVKADWDSLDSKIADYKNKYCIVKEGVSILAEDLFDDFKAKGGELSVRIFGREVKKLGIAHKQIRLGGKRPWIYEGITTKERMEKGLVLVDLMNFGTVGTMNNHIEEYNCELTKSTKTDSGELPEFTGTGKAGTS